jgi:Fe-S cluster assembly scaffold protein SufB
MGNCCVLNRVRNLRTYDTKDIKDPKELEKIKEAKKQVALKKRNKKQELSSEQKQNIDNFYKMTGIIRKE